MSDDVKHEFSPLRIFVWLIILTAVEIGWAELPFLPTIPMRVGLVIFAYMKGHLIFTYFMHMKFEGWIVKGLLVPTIPLMLIVVFATFPDVARNDRLLFPIGFQRVQENGEIMDQAEAAQIRGTGAKPSALGKPATGGH